jgi:ketol-acid reductoisomerase
MRQIKIGESVETVAERADFPPERLRAILGKETVAVLGYGVQGRGQSLNMKDNGVHVIIGLRGKGKGWDLAQQDGWVPGKTLFSLEEAAQRGTIVQYLLSDAGQKEQWPALKPLLTAGKALYFSHGFSIVYSDQTGVVPPKDIDVILVAPKGSGTTVRRLFLEGRGINASFAVHQDIDGKATDLALGWSVALGSPYTFETTLESEYKSDIYGERGILLGAVHGIIESLYRRFVAQGMSREDAFLNSAESITGPISKTISKRGIMAVYEGLDAAGKAEFEKAYAAAYPAAREVLAEIYDEVSTGNEIRGVVMAGERLKKIPMGKIDGTETWKVGAGVRAKRVEEKIPVHPFTAGVYVATMMAQIDILLAKGHPYSEAANESIIESVDSLNPYMHARGVAYMVDNCSTTARLGSRKWAPRFDYLLTQTAYVNIDEGKTGDPALINALKNNVIHKVMNVCCELRPSVDISVS